MKEKQYTQDDSPIYSCTDCNAEVSVDDKVCPNCNADVSKIEKEELEDALDKTTSRRYPALVTIAVICKVLAYLNAISAIIGGVVLSFNLSSSYDFFIIVLPLFIGGIIAFIIFYAASEIIYVFIDIEENTRKVVILMKRANL